MALEDLIAAGNARMQGQQQSARIDDIIARGPARFDWKARRASGDDEAASVVLTVYFPQVLRVRSWGGRADDHVCEARFTTRSAKEDEPL